MSGIPNSPDIRDAETNGMPPYEEINCPCCGEDCQTIYADQYGNVFACDKCLMSQDAWEWYEEEKESYRED